MSTEIIVHLGTRYVQKGPDSQNTRSLEKMTTKELVTLRNFVAVGLDPQHLRNPEIKKFASHEDGVRLTWEILEKWREYAAANPKAQPVTPTPNPAPMVERPAKPSSGQKPAAQQQKPAIPAKKPSKENDMDRKAPITKSSIITVATEENKNPRRENTHGHRSFSLLLAEDNKNADGEFKMTVGAYLDAGGRRNDLMWDLDKGNVTIEHVADPEPAKEEESAEG